MLCCIQFALSLISHPPPLSLPFPPVPPIGHCSFCLHLFLLLIYRSLSSTDYWLVTPSPLLTSYYLPLLYNYVVTLFFLIFIPTIQIDYGDFKQNCFRKFRLQKWSKLALNRFFAHFLTVLHPKFNFFNRNSKNHKDTFVPLYKSFKMMYNMRGKNASENF